MHNGPIAKRAINPLFIARSPDLPLFVVRNQWSAVDFRAVRTYLAAACRMKNRGEAPEIPFIPIRRPVYVGTL